MDLKIEKIGKTTTVAVLILIFQAGSVRHRDIAKHVPSRGALSSALNSLLEEKLVTRQVNTESMPAQTYYTITEKGREVARRFDEIIDILKG
ncbi:winged helix-turn-helix transcriptional regulator [Candidatus Hecatella orcuttiae]|uniref:winged helix-turn-helix transcriptional regulator n=1 Tax=Candidatus Hecatella orcuttiae TaxID=1935119 RepID=UPI002868382E|nr:winged helix-turn-helix transcriptional regulator [Candidatus Hecatella orcuttiae]